MPFSSKLYRADIHRSDQPASLQCYQLQCSSSSGCSGGQQLQQLPDICQQPGSGLQYCHQADLWPHESHSQVQPSSLLTVPCCCEAHLSWCGQPAGEINYRHMMVSVAWIYFMMMLWLMFFLCCKPELCGREADSHLELDGIHNGFHRGSVALWLSVVICWRPRSSQSSSTCLSALCSQGTHKRSGGGQHPLPGRKKVSKIQYF